MIYSKKPVKINLVKIFGFDHELDGNYDQIQHNLIDIIYYKSVKFLGITIIENGFDVKATFKGEI